MLLAHSKEVVQCHKLILSLFLFLVKGGEAEFEKVLSSVNRAFVYLDSDDPKDTMPVKLIKDVLQEQDLCMQIVKIPRTPENFKLCGRYGTVSH